MLDLQIAVTDEDLPARSKFVEWVTAALHSAGCRRRAVAIRVVDIAEIARLNREYRGKNKPTNVLSFPFDPLPDVEIEHLGDLAICSAVVVAEAADQGKPTEAHWAHLVVHGVLHLCGYDHLSDADADAMEALEIRVLADLGYGNPYLESVAPGSSQGTGE